MSVAAPLVLREGDRSRLEALTQRSPVESGAGGSGAAGLYCAVGRGRERPTPRLRPFLRVQLGRVAFEIRDFAAYRSCLGAFRQAHHMARDVFLPPGSARVYNGALTAARDAFYPHTPEAPDPPAVPPGTARGRRVTQVTERSGTCQDL